MEENLGPQEFNEAVRHLLSEVFTHGWVLEAKTSRGDMPVAALFGTLTGPFMLLGDIFFFPWASDRNKVESAVNFINRARRSYTMLFSTDLHDVRKKGFLEYLAKHGIARRVGTIDSGNPQALFQSRKPKET